MELPGRAHSRKHDLGVRHRTPSGSASLRRRRFRTASCTTGGDDRAAGAEGAIGRGASSRWSLRTRAGPIQALHQPLMASQPARRDDQRDEQQRTATSPALRRAALDSPARRRIAPGESERATVARAARLDVGATPAHAARDRGGVAGRDSGQAAAPRAGTPGRRRRSRRGRQDAEQRRQAAPSCVCRAKRRCVLPTTEALCPDHAQKNDAGPADRDALIFAHRFIRHLPSGVDRPLPDLRRRASGRYRSSTRRRPRSPAPAPLAGGSPSSSASAAASAAGSSLGTSQPVSRVEDDLRDAAHPARDHRDAGHHRLENDQGHAFVDRGHDQGRGALESQRISDRSAAAATQEAT